MLVRSWTEGAVAHVQLARPEARNALDRPTIAALHAAVRDAGAAESVRCLVLSGEGVSFCAGGDLHAVRAQTVEETVALNAELLAAIAELETLAVPSIAVLHGHVLGGGLELALGCTLRVADAEARLGLPEARIGLIPGSGGMARLPHLIGRGAALRLLLTGEMIGAAEALALDLVQVCAPAGTAPEAAAALAARIAENGPLAVRAILDVVREHAPAAVRDAIGDGVRRLPAILASADLREGVEAFAERRPPGFTGR
ncbi:MAG: enoyl-CoA hydratase/isomerase family protein [Solirubrobacteraceae bacterium]